MGNEHRVGEFWCIGKFHNLPEICVGGVRGFEIARQRPIFRGIGTSDRYLIFRGIYK